MDKIKEETEIVVKDEEEEKEEKELIDFLETFEKEYQLKLQELIKQFVKAGDDGSLTEIESIMDEMPGNQARQLRDYITGIEQQRQDKLVKTVVDYVTRHDRDEIYELLNRAKVNDDLRNLVDEFILTDWDSEEILSRLTLKVQQSDNLLKSNQARLTKLLYDFEDNRYRVREIFRRLSNINDDEHLNDVLRRLARENLISLEQFNQLQQTDVSKLSNVANVIKNTKVGRGMVFLPRHKRGLIELLNKELSKREVLAVLEELYNRKMLRKSDMESIKKELDDFTREASTLLFSSG